jgi:hypothetical protein
MVSLFGGKQYYIIVDGHEPEGGDYYIRVKENLLDIPIDAVAEGEPDLFLGYIDEYNSGCNFDQDEPLMQEISGDETGTLYFHGRSGWLDFDPFLYDTDWISFRIGVSGLVTIEFVSQIQSRLVQIVPPACGGSIGQDAVALVDAPESMYVAGDPGSIAWIVIHPMGYPPSGLAGVEYSYLLSFIGIAEEEVSTKVMSWGAVKDMFR